MKHNPLKQGILTEHSAGVGTVSRKMVREQAKRELTGEPDTDPQEAILESAPQSERWDPVPGSSGRKIPVTPSADEDDEGRSDNELLVEQGIAEAEHDQMLKASNAATKRNL